jgi:hypothetical protein
MGTECLSFYGEERDALLGYLLRHAESLILSPEAA